MASPIGPGDEVVCISYKGRKLESGAPATGPALIVGRSYRVDRVGYPWGRPVVWLVSPENPCGYHASCFRKIDRISDEFRKALLTPVPLDLEPVEEAQRSEPAEPVPTHGTKARSLSQLQQKEA